MIKFMLELIIYIHSIAKKMGIMLVINLTKKLKVNFGI